MKHACVYCNIHFKLYYNWRRYLETKQHLKKNNTNISNKDLQK